MKAPSTAAKSLRALRDRAGLSRERIGELLGIPATTFATYDTEAYKKPYLPMDLVSKLVPILTGRGDPAIQEAEVWALSGVSPGSIPLPAASAKPARRRLTPETLVINEIDVSAQGGDGMTTPDLDGPERHPVIGQWTMPLDLLNAHMTPGVTPVVIRMVGNSMEPEFTSGDRLLVDSSARLPTPPGIYVLWDGMGLIMKQCELVIGSDPKRVRITSLNPSYAAYEMPLADIQIQGRVMGKWMWK